MVYLLWRVNDFARSVGRLRHGAPLVGDDRAGARPTPNAKTLLGCRQHDLTRTATYALMLLEDAWIYIAMVFLVTPESSRERVITSHVLEVGLV